MAEDLQLFAELCRDVAASESGCLIGQEVRELDREFLFYMQSTRVQNDGLVARGTAAKVHD